ncbi:MAG: hypothetical protein IMZ62_11255 [Chloroflexi bacterium]|nr:hypothetical protein [Chloroflexota bacterium]
MKECAKPIAEDEEQDQEQHGHELEQEEDRRKVVDEGAAHDGLDHVGRLPGIISLDCVCGDEEKGQQHDIDPPFAGEAIQRLLEAICTAVHSPIPPVRPCIARPNPSHAGRRIYSRGKSIE